MVKVTIKIKQVIFLLGAAALLLSGQAYAKTTWRLAQTWGDEHLLGYPTIRLAEIVKELSGGDFTIQLVSKKIHKNNKGIFDFVKDGRYQMGHSASNFWVKKDPDTMFFSAVPFGMVTPELYSWFYEGGGMKLMQRVYGKYGILAYPGGNSGHQMIGWFNKEIKSLEDVKTLKIRLPGLAGEVMKGLGATIINPPVSELRSALETGKVDAVEFVGPAIDLKLGLAEVAKYYYVGWHSPSSEMMFMVNPRAYKLLSKKNRNILDHAMRLAAYDAFVKIVHENGVKMEELLRDYPNVVLRSLPRDVMSALKKENKRLISKLVIESQDGLTKEIVDSMEKYQERARVWTRFSDQAYLNR